MFSVAKNKQATDLKDSESLVKKKVSFQNGLKMIIDLSDDDSHSIFVEEKECFLMPNNKKQNSSNHSISDSISTDQNESEGSDKSTQDNQRQSLLLKEILNSTKTEKLQTIPVNMRLCSNFASLSDPSDQLIHNVSPPTTPTDKCSIDENKEISKVLNHKTVSALRRGDNVKSKSNTKTMPSLPFQHRHESDIGILKKGKIKRHAKLFLRENLQKTFYLSTEKQKRKPILLSATKTASNTNIQKQTHHLRSAVQNQKGPGQPRILKSMILQNFPEDIINEHLHGSEEKKYPCLYCGKVFTRPGGLVGHTRIHTGEKPYKCQTCNKTFADSSSLTKHIRTHTGEKPFKCKFCYRAFSISHNLTRHLKLHSRDKLHLRERKHFNQTSSGKASLQICNDSRLLEKRINKFNLSLNNKLRKSYSGAMSSKISMTESFLVSTVDPADDLQLLGEKSPHTVTNDLTQFNQDDIQKYPTLIRDRHLAKEIIMPENDIKPILKNVSSLQMKMENSNTDQECVLTSCPDSENNYFSNIEENLEQTICIPSLVDSEYDPKEKIQKCKETNEILNKDSCVNSLNDASLTYKQSFSGVSKNISNNFESQPKVEPCWYNSVNEEIESERAPFLSNNQNLGSTTIVSVNDGNYTNNMNDANYTNNMNDGNYTNNSECLLKLASVQLPLLESNEQQTALNDTSQPSHIYRCGYCPQEFKDIHLLSQHIQVHDKKSELRIEGKAREIRTSVSETESFREMDILKKEIDLTFNDKSHRMSEETELTSNSQHENMYAINFETRVTESTEPQSDLSFSNLSLSSMKASTEPKENDNFDSLKNSQPKIPSRQTLFNGINCKFRCTYCSKTFNRRAGLIGHLRVHTGEKPHVCRLCSKRFSDSSSLTKHIRTHTGEKPFKCQICLRAFSISHNLTRHLKLHTKEKQQLFNKNKSGNLFRSAEKANLSIRCRYCSATFKSLRILKCHLRYHSFTSQTLKAGKRDAVRNDQKIIHNANDPVIEKTKTLTDERNELPISSFNGNIISENFFNKKKFSSVNKIQNKIIKNRNYHFGMTNSGSLERKYISREINFQTFPQTTLWSNLTSTGMTLESSEETKNNEVVPSSLSITEESSNVVTTLQNNASMPQKELKFTEQLNPRTAAFSKDGSERNSIEIKPINEESESRVVLKSSQMNNEADLTAGGELRISKQNLETTFIEKTSVDRHKTYINENVPIYSDYSCNHDKEIEKTSNHSTSGSKCGYCHKSFRDFSSLSKHMSMHKEQQSRQFKRYSSNRVSLLHNWASSSSNKRLKMLRFGFERTKLWRNLSKKNGRMYACPFCSKQFTRRGGLVGHLRVHTGEKPHECRTCHKRFSDSSSLTKHIRTHTGEKPFHCKLCPRAFSISHNLTRHLKLHSRDGLKVSNQGQKVTKNEKSNEAVNINEQLEERNIRSSFNVSHSSSHELCVDYCKTSQQFDEQFCQNKNTVSHHQIFENSNPVSSSSLNVNPASSNISSDQQYPHLEKIPSHMRRSFEPVLRMTTNHLLSNVPDLSLSISNHNVSSTQLLDNEEITLEYKPEFLSPSNQELNAPKSDVANPISLSRNINHLPSISTDTLSLTSHAQVSTAHLVSSNTKAVDTLNKNPQISSNRNEPENQTNPFSDTFSKTVLLLKSLSDYNSNEMNDLQPKYYSQNLTAENLQPNQIPNSCTKLPNSNSTVLTSSFPTEKDISDSFFSPIKPLRSSCITDDNCTSIETVLSNVTERPLIEIDCASSVDKKLFKPMHTFQNSQTFASKNAKNQAQEDNTFAEKPSQSRRSQKTPVHKNTCILCRTYYQDFQQLEAHLKIHRTQNKTFTCGYCNRNFARFSGLMGHARVHTLERPYRCKICERAFSDSSSLTKHTRIHTGEKPFTCKYCLRTFSISHNLTRHLKIHLREKKRFDVQ